MEDVFSALIKNNHFIYFMKPYKEDQFIQPQSKKPKKDSLYPIKNFVPVIRPKKAFRRPSPLQLNPDSFEESESHKKNLTKKKIYRIKSYLIRKK